MLRQAQANQAQDSVELQSLLEELAATCAEIEMVKGVAEKKGLSRQDLENMDVVSMSLAKGEDGRNRCACMRA